MAEITVTKDNFEEVVLKAEKTVLLDFWASWCGPCKMLAPIIAEIAEENEDSLVVAKCNVDDVPEIAIQYKIASIPTVLIFKGGNVVNKCIGYRPKVQIEELFK